MASSVPDFEEWLCGALEAAGVDGEVYGGYISGSLAAMEGSAREEIEETVEEILSGCVESEDSCRGLCQRVVDEWLRREGENLTELREEEDKAKELAVHVPMSGGGVSAGRSEREGREKKSSLLEGLSAKEKQKLVAQYGDLSNDEEDNVDDIADDPGGGGASSSYQAPKMTDVFHNMNAQSVAQAEREQKEKDKLAHEMKADRDRRNKETQKQKVLDRKEKEKKRTQKHERRR